MGRSRVHSATPGGSSTTEGRGKRAMKPWDVLRREAAGLRRSIQYDLIRRAEAQRTIAARRPTEVLDADRARRAFTVTGVSLVLAGGAAGTYLTVADPLLGTLIDGRYRVRARVARGGMATVYTALDERLERTVALKIIHPSQVHDARFLIRFGDEAKTIAQLTHPNV